MVPWRYCRGGGQSVQSISKYKIYYVICKLYSMWNRYNCTAYTKLYSRGRQLYFSGGQNFPGQTPWGQTLNYNEK